VYVTGQTSNYGVGAGDLVLLKYGADGTLLSQRTWGGNAYDSGRSVAVDGAGNVYVTGISTSFVTGSDHYGNCILLKYDSSGSLLWQRAWGGINEDCGSGVAAGASGVVFVAGGTDSFGGGRELFLLKLDSSGGLLRQKTWGGSVMDGGYSVTVDGSGRVFAAGESPNAYGSWRDAGGDVSSPAGTETSPEGTESTPEGVEMEPTGTETAPVGVEDGGGGMADGLVMKADPLDW
jgi:hypothetical protein